MSSKKKKPAIKKVEPVVEEHPEPEPQDDVPSRQIEEVHQTEPEPVEQHVEPEPVAGMAPIVAPVAQEAEPGKSAEVEPLPVVEPAPVPVPPSKPKSLTLISLHSDIESLRQIVEQQAIIIKQLLEAPVKQRKPPLSNGKVQIKDTLTGKIYPSKNNVYQSLLKAGELDDLVKQGVFGSDPAKNSFGCYNLFRAYPNRFVEIKPEEIKV